MGEYLFGQDFGSFQGVTDPRLQERLIGAEQRFRPQYAGLELADINTFATGIPGGTDNPQYRRLEAQLAGLEAGQGGISSEEATKIARAAAGPAPSKTFTTTSRTGRNKGRTYTSKNPNYEKELEEYNREVQSLASSLGGNRASQIASVKAEMAQLESSPGQRGLFDLLEEQSTRAGALQRSELELQRESDVGALQRFAPQVVEAYREADPFSTEIAESMSRRALGQLTPEEERNVQQRSRQASLARGRIGDSSSIAAEALGRSDYTSQFAQPAFAMNRQLAGDVGMTILGRPSASIGLGGQVLGQAQQGAAGPMGPQLFDPNMGINMALQQRSQDINYQGAMAQANAAKSAGMMQGLGSALGAFTLPCWVAREVYGIENPKWLEFRYWMMNDAPSWFRNLYIKYGEKIAKFISNKPRIKSIIRKWMNTKIK
tara:strand:- start:4 stop:1299 length:1296 start_codon:yes stop_codon:yes gene_type:complete